MREISLLPYKKPVLFNKKIKYITKIESIIYIMVEIWIDILFAMSIVCYFTKNLRLDHFIAIDQILRHLASSLKKDIIFGKEFKRNLIWYLVSD